MSKKVIPPTAVAPEDPENILSFCTKIVATGFCAATELQKEYGNEVYTKMIALLFSTHHLLRKVERPWKDGKEVTGFIWANRRFSKAEMRGLPPEVQMVMERYKQGRTKYGDYTLPITIHCEWTNFVLGGIPAGGEDKYNRFDRGPDGSVLIPAYCIRAMVSKALPMMGKEQAIARRIGWASILVHKPDIQMTGRPVIDNDGFTGLGITRSEYLPIGTQFAIRAKVPTTVLTEDEYVSMIRMAGEFVRLSPARSSGFGDFKVLRVS